jgi:hypothetical protein
MDILIDVLDNFLESFFKLCNNLQSIHQVDLNANESEFHPNNFYSNQVFKKKKQKLRNISAIRVNGLERCLILLPFL